MPEDEEVIQVAPADDDPQVESPALAEAASPEEEEGFLYKHITTIAIGALVAIIGWLLTQQYNANKVIGVMQKQVEATESLASEVDKLSNNIQALHLALEQQKLENVNTTLKVITMVNGRSPMASSPFMMSPDLSINNTTPAPKSPWHIPTPSPAPVVDPEAMELEKTLLKTAMEQRKVIDDLPDKRYKK